MTQRSHSRRIGVTLALLLLVVAAVFLLQPDWFRSRLLRWFGPPQVTLAETYAGDQGDSEFDHAPFDRLLGESVDATGLVDYRGLVSQSERLDSYIDSLAQAPLEQLGRDERLALLINAYNAFTLRLILDHYPIESIRDIPGAQRWDAAHWNLAGETYSLNQIEHELVRPNFREPRIHFALVCAAIGCPPLRSEAYSGERLDEQLHAQARHTHLSDRWVRYRSGSGKIELTSLYEWYGGDFEQVAGSILDYVAGYRDDLATDLASGQEIEVRFLDYDWSLNEQLLAELDSR